MADHKVNRILPQQQDEHRHLRRTNLGRPDGLGRYPGPDLEHHLKEHAHTQPHLHDHQKHAIIEMGMGEGTEVGPEAGVLVVMAEDRTEKEATAAVAVQAEGGDLRVPRLW